MTKYCSYCEWEIEDGAPVVATVVSKFKHIRSDRTFAIEVPTECIEVQHMQCSEYVEDKGEPSGC